MDKDFLLDRFSGCMLGLAIGDALGAPAEDMTAFQVMNKFHAPIDMFYPYQSFKPGKYTCETMTAMNIVDALINGQGKFDEATVTAAREKISARCLYDLTMGARTLFSKVVPVGLLCAAHGFEGQEMVNMCKFLAIPEMKKRDILATFIFSYVVKEIIRNSENLTKPYELYDSDRSLLSRAIEFCHGSEAKFEKEAGETSLSEYLGFVRKKLMVNWDLLKFSGMIGSSTGMAEALSIALFAYLQAPDDFSTICKTVSLGGPASLHGAMIGALVGATIGGALVPSDMKDLVEKGVTIESRAILFATTCLPAEEQAPIEEELKTDGDSA